jgi:hypothetical protein
MVFHCHIEGLLALDKLQGFKDLLFKNWDRYASLASRLALSSIGVRGNFWDVNNIG